MSRLLKLSALSFTLVLFSFSLFMLLGPSASANQADSTIDLIATDAVPAGNTADSLGTIDSCVETAVGSDATVDLVVDSVPDDRAMIAFDVHVRYDPTILEATAVDYEQLLAAQGAFNPLDALSDTLPDSDGDLYISIIDLASNAPGEKNEETGPGVLARITFRAKAAGTSNVAPAYELDVVYPVVFDFNAIVIGVNEVQPAAVVVGGSCPPAGAPLAATPLPPLGDLIPPTDPTDPGATPQPNQDGPMGDDEPTDSDPGDGDDGNSSTGGDGSAGGDGDSGPPNGGLSTPSDQVGAGGSEGPGGSDGSDGVPVTLIVVLSVVGVGAAGGGGWALYRWRQGRA